MKTLEFRDISLRWTGCGSEVRVFEKFTCPLSAGEFVALVGPNASGKSSLLRLATGLLKPTSGAVFWGGQRVYGPCIERGYLPQQPRLFEWLPLHENVAFGPRMLGVNRAERRRIAEGLLDRLGLGAWSQRFPSELSGGMRARVALAMTLANKPKLVCLDESFAALDFQTRLVTQQALVDFWKQGSPTVIMVTHQIDEALIADRVLVLSGRPGTITLDHTVAHLGSGREGDEKSRSLVSHTLTTAASAAFRAELGQSSQMAGFRTEKE